MRLTALLFLLCAAACGDGIDTDPGRDAGVQDVEPAPCTFDDPAPECECPDEPGRMSVRLCDPDTHLRSPHCWCPEVPPPTDGGAS